MYQADHFIGGVWIVFKCRSHYGIHLIVIQYILFKCHLNHNIVWQLDECLKGKLNVVYSNVLNLNLCLRCHIQYHTSLVNNLIDHACQNVLSTRPCPIFSFSDLSCVCVCLSIVFLFVHLSLPYGGRTHTNVTTSITQGLIYGFSLYPKFALPHYHHDHFTWPPEQFVVCRYYMKSR